MSILQKSASTCAAETERGEHLFKISGYSLHRGLGVGYYIQSPTFAIGGHQWCIQYYPDGYSEDSNKDEVAVALELIEEDPMHDPDPPRVRVSSTVSFFHWATQRFSPWAPVMTTLSYPFSLAMHHINRSEVEATSAGYVVDDRLTIKYAVTVFKEACVLPVEDPSSANNSDDDGVFVVKVPPSDIVEHLGKLLETKEGTDVTFQVQGEEFPAHKLVLAMRSPVFKAELYGPMRDDKDSSRRLVIVVHDMQPAVFSDLLYFIYNDSLPAAAAMEDDEQTTVDRTRHLLVAADRYAMERLKLVCESLLSNKLDVESVATTLALADRHTCSALKDACIRFIASSTDAKTGNELVRSEGYLELKRNCPCAVMEMWEEVNKLRKT